MKNKTKTKLLYITITLLLAALAFTWWYRPAPETVEVEVPVPVPVQVRAPAPEPEFRNAPIKKYKPGYTQQMGLLVGPADETLPLYESKLAHTGIDITIIRPRVVKIYTRSPSHTMLGNARRI